MSKFSGKCDFYDWFFTEKDKEKAFEEFKGTKLYKRKKKEECDHPSEDFMDNLEEIHYESLRDLVPFYPYLVILTSTNQESRSCVLSSESFVDQEERKILEFYKEEVLKAYRRCKRKKIEFTEEEVDKTIGWTPRPEIVMELYRRVKEKGKKATTEGMHLSIHQYYREQLRKEMENHMEEND